MNFTIECKACGASFKVPDAIYERRIKGRLATLVCKKCKAPIEIDDRASAVDGETTAEPKPNEAEEPALVSILPARVDEPAPPEATQAEQPQVEDAKPEAPAAAKPEEPEAAKPEEPEAAKPEEPEAAKPEEPEAAKPAEPEAPEVGVTKAPELELAQPTKAEVPQTTDAPKGLKLAKPLGELAKAPRRVQSEPELPRFKLESGPDETPAPKPFAGPRPVAKFDLKLKRKSAPSIPNIADPSEIPPPPISISDPSAAAAIPPPATLPPLPVALVEPQGPAKLEAAPEPTPAVGTEIRGERKRKRPREEPASDRRRSTSSTELTPVHAEAAPRGSHAFLVAFLIGAAVAAAVLFFLRGRGALPLPTDNHAAEPAVPALAPTLTTPVGTAQADNKVFDRKGATKALEAAAETAGLCRKIGGPEGTAYAAVTIAPSGSVESVRITNAPFEGTATGTCIAEELRKIRVSPFSGSSVVITQTVRVR